MEAVSPIALRPRRTSRHGGANASAEHVANEPSPHQRQFAALIDLNLSTLSLAGIPDVAPEHFPPRSQIRGELIRAAVALSERCLVSASRWALELAATLNVDDREHFVNSEFSSSTSVHAAALATVSSSIDESSARASNAGAGTRVAQSTPMTAVTPKGDLRRAALRSNVSKQMETGVSARDDSDMNMSVDMDTDMETDLPASTPFSSRSPAAPGVDTDEMRLVAAESHSLLLAKAYYDAKDLPSAHAQLLECRSRHGVFLRSYIYYLLGEKRRDEEARDYQVDHLRGVENKHSQALLAELWALREQTALDGYGLYVLGMVLRDRKRLADARLVFAESVQKEPLNWSAWHDLAVLLDEDYKRELEELPLPDHWMRHFFLIDALMEVQRNVEALRICEQLTPVFGTAVCLVAARARAQYQLREFDEAERLFEHLLSVCPNRLDDLDLYSNVLYVKGNARKLSMLAHHASSLDRYRPETCVIIANFYSMKYEHEKALLYFERALRLNPRYLSAWTLMGHEYMELKKTNSAVEAYRCAVEINPRDYRAWYGIAQAYEILKMPLYAMYYYTKVIALRPYDPRMWTALGMCFEALEQDPNAIRCYERALANGDREGVAMPKLANLYERIGDDDKAAFYYKRSLVHMSEYDVHSAEKRSALLFLAEHCCKRQLLDDAAKYAEQLLDFSGIVKEQAKAILRTVSALRTAQGM